MSHLTKEQRYTIGKLYQSGKTKTEIAAIISKHKSVITREIQHNCDKRNGKYDADLAQRKCEKRHADKAKNIALTQAVKDHIAAMLAQKYSPEQIAGSAKKQGIPCVSHERIYQHIWQDKKQKGVLYFNLRTQGKRYRKRGSAKDKRGIIKDRVDISNRDPIVENRERFGDLEIDTIIGKDHKGAIITINDRATGMLKMKKTNGKDAKDLAANVAQMLQEWKPYLFTITADNGKEFADHKTIAEALELQFFFARPYHSWERGSNENLNGLIRQYIPKKTDFDTITDQYIQQIETDLNNRPRKRFNFESPLKMFQQKVAFIT
jgi:transposase, IS30 family